MIALSLYLLVFVDIGNGLIKKHCSETTHKKLEPPCSALNITLSSPLKPGFLGKIYGWATYTKRSFLHYFEMTSAISVLLPEYWWFRH